jgi:hypothetical protein
VAGDGRVGIALNVGAPFPAGSVWVTSTDVLCLKALEFLLGSEFIGLELLAKKGIETAMGGLYHFLLICTY